MSSERPGPRLGGLGALFFIGTLGAIALYVQRQSVPEERDVVRKAATALPQVEEEEAPPALPWQDRLDLGQTTLIPFAGTSPPNAGAEPGTTAPTDPADGRLVQDLSDGHRILLTLDPVIQDSALQIFRNREVPYGAAVMLDLRDNAVLAFAGHSSMDPEVDPLEILTTAWAPAASVFKLVTTSALLESEAATRATRVCFTGGLHGITDESLRDVPGKDEQCATLAAAVAHSHNLVIAKLALKHLDQDQLVAMTRRLQFETDIPFEFLVERSPAHIPSEAMQRAKVAAGFWNVDMSPIHGALLASVFARGGNYQPPHIIDRVIGSDGADVTPPRPTEQRVLGKRIAREIGQMMLSTTKEGTARASFLDGQGNPYIPEVEVAGKTGSLTGKRAPALNYNWFVAFAPAQAPEIALAVVLANEPRWRIKAHYAGRRLIQIWQRRRQDITRQRDAQLTRDGLVLPTRNAAGVLVAAKPAKAQAGGKNDDAGAPPAAAAKPDGSAHADGDAPGSAEPPLPPVPGPVPKAAPGGS